MIKRIISTVALLLILEGCGSSSSKSEEVKPKVSSEVKSFVSGLSSTNKITSMVKNTGSGESSSSQKENNTYQKEMLRSCEEGGTLGVTANIDYENMDAEAIKEISTNGLNAVLVFDDCIEEGVKSNGSISMTLSEHDGELSRIIITFNENTTFEELELAEVVTVFKDSTMEIDELSDDQEKITESIKISSSTGEAYESRDLISYEHYGMNHLSSYEVSGVIVHQESTYRVDEQYDGSKTPMVLEEYEVLTSGTAKYYNEKNHHITITVVDENKIKVSVDTDNDGTMDEEEMITL